MKAKLVKIDYQFFLYDNDDNLIATTENTPYKRLSMKNCQAIERGYDLDELAREFCHPGNGVRDNFQPVFKGIFIQGFQKALELMGDKKFNEKDVILIAEYIRVASQSTPNVRTKDLFDEYQSLQQTEWDVEIEMICPHPSDTYRCGIQYGCDEDGCNHPNQVPYLDAEGCLILKRQSG